MLTKYIYKDLAFIWLFSVSFLFPHSRYREVEPSIAQHCREKSLIQPSSYAIYSLTKLFRTFPLQQVPCSDFSVCTNTLLPYEATGWYKDRQWDRPYSFLCHKIWIEKLFIHVLNMNFIIYICSSSLAHRQNEETNIVFKMDYAVMLLFWSQSLCSSDRGVEPWQQGPN